MPGARAGDKDRLARVVSAEQRNEVGGHHIKVAGNDEKPFELKFR